MKNKMNKKLFLAVGASVVLSGCSGAPVKEVKVEERILAR